MLSFFTRRWKILTPLTMATLVVIGLSIIFVDQSGNYNGLVLILILWLALMGLGAVMTAVASVVILYFWFRKRSLSPQWQQIWSRALLFGLWLLLVGGGTCVLWWSGAALMPI